MLQLLDQVCSEQNLTLLMVSHNLDDAARIAPRTLLVADGRIAYDGTTSRSVRWKESGGCSVTGAVAPF